jgi:hypothetical protein
MCHKSYLIPETLKQLQEDIGKILEDTDIDNELLNRTLIAQEMRTRIDK